jgi:hypothetical protein
MTQLICLAYQPGAYGSFLSWVVDRFSAERKKHQPIVTDNPLLPDGSGHNYVTYCKIQNNDNFIAMMDLSRSKEKPWGYNIYAGWPVGVREKLIPGINNAVENLQANDKMILLECTTAEEHVMRYLRNEPTMDQARWYGMIEATDEDDLLVRLKADINNEVFNTGYENENFLRINMNDINNSKADDFFDKVTSFLNWEVCDRELFNSVFEYRKTLQTPYYEQLKRINAGVVNTPAERVIHRYIKGE